MNNRPRRHCKTHIILFPKTNLKKDNTHTHTHTHTHTQDLRGGALGGCVFFNRGESTKISTQMKDNIMNWTFKTEFCMFKVNNSKFNVMVAIASRPVEAFKNDQNTHKNKNRMVP